MATRRGFTLIELVFVLLVVLGIAWLEWTFVRWLLDWNPIVPPYWQFLLGLLVVNLVGYVLPDGGKIALNLAFPVAAYFYVSHLQATMAPAGAAPTAAAASAPASSARYWLNAQGQTMGPYDVSTLQGFARDGRVTARSQLMQEGTSTWTTADKVSGLLGAR